MNNKINEILSRLDDAVFNIDVKVKAINDKLDELIKALHDYDGDEWDEPNDALKEAAAQYNKLVAPCVGHDMASWEEEERLNERMDVIGQNGNEGLHYDEDEFDDYGKRVVRDRDTQDKHVVGDKDKKRNKRKYYKPKQPKSK